VALGFRVDNSHLNKLYKCGFEVFLQASAPTPTPHLLTAVVSPGLTRSPLKHVCACFDIYTYFSPWPLIKFIVRGVPSNERSNTVVKGLIRVSCCPRQALW
jgi:hypothetical protein